MNLGSAHSPSGHFRWFAGEQCDWCATLTPSSSVLANKVPNKHGARIFQKSKAINSPIKAPLGFVLSNIFPAC